MENNEPMPIEQIRAIVKSQKNGITDKLDSEFNNYIDSDNKDVSNGIKKHNKKTFNLFKKRKEKINADRVATEIYETRYDRETWFYLRHSDTIDKYIKQDDKPKSKVTNNPNTIIVENPKSPEEEALRIGYAKMLLIVWFDMFVFVLGCALFFPIHLIRYITELFFKMKRALAVTVLIIFVLIVLSVGLTFGINALFSYARSLS